MQTILTSRQSIEKWDTIKEAMLRALPPTAAPQAENILASIANGDLVVWVVSRPKGYEDEIIGIVTVAVVIEPFSLTKNLLLYTASTIATPRANDIIDLFDALRKYAKSKGCKGIIAYSANQTIKSVCERLGADISYSLINLEV